MSRKMTKELLYYSSFFLSEKFIAVGRGRADHDQQHCYHHSPTVKPEANTAVVELLMIGDRTPETR
jgi:hypothetical protein